MHVRLNRNEVRQKLNDIGIVSQYCFICKLLFSTGTINMRFLVETFKHEPIWIFFGKTDNNDIAPSSFLHNSVAVSRSLNIFMMNKNEHCLFEITRHNFH